MAARESVVLIHYRAQPDKVDVARASLMQLVATVTATEKDCLGIEVHESADDAGRFMLFERWTSREAYQGPHMVTPHLKAFIAGAGEFLAGPPEISYWEKVDD